ncbi:MAG: hypothetical protein JWL73_1824 [Actinomycetia bacterium]|nr:hypothetical protein [Actinomycetes bacterium]
MTDPELLEPPDGYRFVTRAPVQPDDFDAQGHLNNAAIVRIFNDTRMIYVPTQIGPRWTNWLRPSGVVVVAKELHVRYESEGMPGDELLAAVRMVERRGRATIVEQQLLTRADRRVIASAWIVQLLAKDGAAIEWPDWYWPLLEAVEGHPFPPGPSLPRVKWGAPPLAADVE